MLWSLASRALNLTKMLQILRHSHFFKNQKSQGICFLFTAETEPHEGKRKVEAMWPIFRLHHQKSRYIYDLFYRRKAISRGKLLSLFLLSVPAVCTITL